MDFEFLVNGSFMIFRTNNNSSFFGEAGGTQFCLIKIKRKNADIYLAFVKMRSKPPAGTPLGSTIKEWC